MTPEVFQRWTECKKRIATCRECINRWSPRIEATLRVSEVPDPWCPVSILFVGVAPPPLGQDGDQEVGHFYTNPYDRLRLGLFHVLDRIFKTDMIQRNGESCEAGTAAFLHAGFFFLHAAKVRPCRGRSAPTHRIMRFCAQHHLAEEISLVQPQAICFLGKTNATAAAESVFRRKVNDKPVRGEIPDAVGSKKWRGWVVTTVQPVRGTKQGPNSERTIRTIEQLRDRLAGAL